jgi:hypothetical protein
MVTGLAAWRVLAANTFALFFAKKSILVLKIGGEGLYRARLAIFIEGNIRHSTPKVQVKRMEGGGWRMERIPDRRGGGGSWARWVERRPAGLETRDTAGFQTCGTVQGGGMRESFRGNLTPLF